MYFIHRYMSIISPVIKSSVLLCLLLDFASQDCSGDVNLCCVADCRFNSKVHW